MKFNLNNVVQPWVVEEPWDLIILVKDCNLHEIYLQLSEG